MRPAASRAEHRIAAPRGRGARPSSSVAVSKVCSCRSSAVRGVRSSCAASAMNARSCASDASSRDSRSFSASTSGRTSSGRPESRQRIEGPGAPCRDQPRHGPHRLERAADDPPHEERERRHQHAEGRERTQREPCRARLPDREWLRYLDHRVARKDAEHPPPAAGRVGRREAERGDAGQHDVAVRQVDALARQRPHLDDEIVLRHLVGQPSRGAEAIRLVAQQERRFPQVIVEELVRLGERVSVDQVAADETDCEHRAEQPREQMGAHGSHDGSSR